MKKIILLLLIFCTSAFGYYSSEAFIDLLVQPNQLRVRTDRVGVLFGNENIRAAIGLTWANSLSGIIVHNVSDFQTLNNAKKGLDQFVPAALAGIGYQMGIFGIALGYEFKWKGPTYMVHTPVLSMTALDNDFRINIPISVGVGQKSYYHPDRESLKGTMVISTGIEARYYFNTILNHLRFYFNYGNSTIKEINNPSTNFTQQSVGFQLRAYFNYDLSDYKITPIIRFQFDTALATRYKNIDKSYKIVDNYFITAKGFSPTGGSITEGHYGSTGANANLNSGGLAGGYIASIPNTYYAEEPYRIGIALPVGFRTVSESGTIELYVEPALSLTIVNAKRIYSFSEAMLKGLGNLTEDDRRKSPFYTFGYVVYGELYIRPRPRLEWYTEIQTGGATVAGELANTSGTTSLILNASTGITWYF